MTVEAPVRPVTADRGWFDEAVRRHYRLVFSIAWQVLGSAADAEDAAQDAFLRAYRARDALFSQASVEPWLAQIARTAALDLGRKRGREAALKRAVVARTAGPQINQNGESEGVSATKAPQIHRNGESGPGDPERLRAAVAALPEADALVVTLRFVDGLSAAEIGARLGLEPGTVRVRLHRALERLRGVLQGREEE